MIYVVVPVCFSKLVDTYGALDNVQCEFDATDTLNRDADCY